MNKRIKRKHFVCFAEAVMYYREEGLEWCSYQKAKPVGGKAAKKCWQYALECGHEYALDEKPIFRPERKYVFAVTQTDDFRRLVEPIRVTPIDADKPAHRDTPRPTRNSR